MQIFNRGLPIAHIVKPISPKVFFKMFSHETIIKAFYQHNIYPVSYVKSEHDTCAQKLSISS